MFSLKNLWEKNLNFPLDFQVHFITYLLYKGDIKIIISSCPRVERNASSHYAKQVSAFTFSYGYKNGTFRAWRQREGFELRVVLCIILFLLCGGKMFSSLPNTRDILLSAYINILSKTWLLTKNWFSIYIFTIFRINLSWIIDSNLINSLNLFPLF